ncbi:sugar phosphate isomerase/epimerase family protein [Paenibacillus yanchengensis]|uniref:Sugar phosphate isomerase/epimerase family protein n=1 Tax=Paenibacillus yanchengensis TaxID=2035833 RepID=A0ABW4YK57_9BACL
MKLGMSSYCVLPALKSGELHILDVPKWVKDHGGEHLELVPYGFTLIDQPELADQLRKRAEEEGIELSNYSMPANFVQDTEEEFVAEVNRLKEHVDLLDRMNIRHMRHDVTAFTLPHEKTLLPYFLNSFDQIIEGSKQIADYAAQFGITTTIENHGFSVQQSDRVQQVLLAVDRPNFKTTLDIGNFLCVDEDPMVGVKNNLPYASLVHVKDFYIRPFDEDPGEGAWIKTTHGNFIRGSIFGQGDVEIRKIFKYIKESGYDDKLTLEFEGMEECLEATRISLNNVRRLWDAV